MFGSTTLTDPVTTILVPPAVDEVRWGLVVPQSGPLGLTSPAALAAAALAAEEINAGGGVRGRRLSLVVVDAGREPDLVAQGVAQLLATSAVEALIGFHTSDVHRALERVIAGRVPYLFTPPHEGGRRRPGVGLSGPGPIEQIRPAVPRLVRRSIRRWALVGNDYIWPRAVHAAAVPLIAHAGGSVVAQSFVPLGDVDPERILATLRGTSAQAVLLSLVGRDLATFNRAFAQSSLAGQVVRLSGALDETGLLEIDGDVTGELFATMDWFASDADADGVLDRYAVRWGPHPPPLGGYARGCYDGIALLGRLAQRGELQVAGFAHAVAAGRLTVGPRSRLARADGTRLVPVSP